MTRAERAKLQRRLAAHARDWGWTRELVREKRLRRLVARLEPGLRLGQEYGYRRRRRFWVVKGPGQDDWRAGGLETLDAVEAWIEARAARLNGSRAQP